MPWFGAKLQLVTDGTRKARLPRAPAEQHAAPRMDSRTREGEGRSTGLNAPTVQLSPPAGVTTLPMIVSRKQYIDAILWDTAMGVCRQDIRKNWPSLHGLSKDSAAYKIAVQEIAKLKEREFAQEWEALREFLKT